MRAFLYVFLTFEKCFNPSAYGRKALIFKKKGAEGLVFQILQHGSAELCDYMETHGRHAKPAVESTKPGPGGSIPAFRKPKGGLVAETC